MTGPDWDSLVQAGKINSDTLVWREGMAEWQPYQYVKTTPSAGRPPVVVPPLADGVLCSECGRSFPVGDVIHFNGVNVCAGCKPIFVQKLREGIKVGAGVDYASFGLRFGAAFLDGIITAVAGAFIGAIVGGVMGATLGIKGAGMFAIQLVSIAITFLFRLGYYTFFTGKFGATPGKMACKIKVVNADGSPVSYGKSAARFLAYIVSSLTLFIGYLMMLWDDEKRTLHDRICDTRVIRS